jgi:hypothetical protein
MYSQTYGLGKAYVEELIREGRIKILPEPKKRGRPKGFKLTPEQRAKLSEIHLARWAKKRSA